MNAKVKLIILIFITPMISMVLLALFTLGIVVYDMYGNHTPTSPSQPSNYTVKDVINDGFNIVGYRETDTGIEIIFDKNRDKELTQQLTALTSEKTIGEIKQNNDLTLFVSKDGKPNEFSGYINGIYFHCTLDEEAIKNIIRKYNDKFFYDCNEIKEIQNLKINDISEIYITVTITLNEESSKLLKKSDNYMKELEINPDKYLLKEKIEIKVN